MKRDPRKVHALLRSLARNTATLAEVTTLAADIGEREQTDISRPTATDYLAALGRLMIVENQPAWNTHLRSSASLRKAPKRHFTDPCLAAAALGADSAALLDDLLSMGFLFESLAIHDLRIYAQANDAHVFHYRDSRELEIDVIVQKRNGDWCAFEIKLGTGQIEAALENLKKLVTALDPAKTNLPKSLNVITGTGISYRRADGINVLSMIKGNQRNRRLHLVFTLRRGVCKMRQEIFVGRMTILRIAAGILWTISCMTAVWAANLA